MKDQESNPRPHTPRPAALPMKVEQWFSLYGIAKKSGGDGEGHGAAGTEDDDWGITQQTPRLCAARSTTPVSRTVHTGEVRGGGAKAGGKKAYLQQFLNDANMLRGEAHVERGGQLQGGEVPPLGRHVVVHSEDVHQLGLLGPEGHHRHLGVPNHLQVGGGPDARLKVFRGLRRVSHPWWLLVVSGAAG